MCRSATRNSFLVFYHPPVLMLASSLISVVSLHRLLVIATFFTGRDSGRQPFFLTLVSVKTCTIVAIPVCVDLIFSFQLKAKCYRSRLGNPRRSAGMKENECQRCLFPNSWRVSPCGVEAPTNPQEQRERLSDWEWERWYFRWLSWVLSKQNY